jgi:xanthine dehydrogenase YagT iron-sulfur-binding subunit
MASLLSPLPSAIGELLPVGSAAPDFFIDSGCGAESTALSQLKGQSVVLLFSRPGWDPARDEFKAAYARVLTQVDGIKATFLDLADDFTSCRLAVPGESTEINIALMTDIDSYGEVAAAYGVRGRNALFLVNESGEIAWSYAARLDTQPKADELLAALRSAAPQPSNLKRESNKVLPLTRRQFVAATIAAALGLSLYASRSPAHAQGEGTYAPEMTSSSAPVGAMNITLTVNGTDSSLSIDPRVTLLDALREHLGLTGSKKGCDHGQCGACTVHLNGRRINSCLALAVSCQGKPITTIEGLASGDKLHAMQDAFIAHDGFQCGYCTSGQIMSAVALMNESWGPDDSDVREGMSGNICRCGAYPNIVDAIQDVRGNRTKTQVQNETNPRNT